jgi:hypothetical protein
MNVYNFGLPVYPDSHSMDAIVLYNVIESLPLDEGVARAIRHAEGWSTAANNASPPLPLLSVNVATENCNTTNNPASWLGDNIRAITMGGGAWGRTLREHVG